MKREYPFASRAAGRLSALAVSASMDIAHALGCGLLLCTLSAFAQTYNIDWHSIDGGGAMSIGGVYSVTGTIGQPDVGTMTGGSYALAGGFWSLLTIVQTPGAPRLTIVNTGTNAVKVRWPDPSAGWVLQQNLDLNPANWVTNALPVVVEGTNRCVTVSAPAGRLLFRLNKP